MAFNENGNAHNVTMCAAPLCACVCVSCVLKFLLFGHIRFSLVHETPKRTLQLYGRFILFKKRTNDDDDGAKSEEMAEKMKIYCLTMWQL